MKLNLASFAFFSVVAGACSNGPLNPGVGPHGLTVRASLSAVSLAEDCAQKSPPAGDSAGTCIAGTQCGDLCQQSNLQIDLAADAGGTEGVPVEIVRVRVFASGSDDALSELAFRAPQHWVDNSSYAAWDSKLEPASSEKASWKLAAPDWATLDSGRLAAPQAVYRIEVSLKIDGEERTLTLDGVTREPLVST